MVSRLRCLLCAILQVSIIRYNIIDNIKEDIVYLKDICIEKEISLSVIGDDASFLKMVKDWLSDDYRVTIVSSGMQAITYIAKSRPDLILLDYEMPVTSGPQVLEMIRSEVGTSNLPVFFLTGKGDKESVTKVLNLKPEGYILKSAGKTELVSQIKDYFERHKSV